jgi:hypothetical protein
MAPRYRLPEIFVEVRQVQVVLIHAADRRQNSRNSRLALPEQHQVHRHRAESNFTVDRRYDDPGVGAIKSRRRQKSKQEAPGVAAQREAAVLDKQLVENIAIALQ